MVMVPTPAEHWTPPPAEAVPLRGSWHTLGGPDTHKGISKNTLSDAMLLWGHEARRAFSPNGRRVT